MEMKHSLGLNMAYNLVLIVLSKLRNLMQLFFMNCSNLFNALELWLLDHSSLTKNQEVSNHFTSEQLQSIIKPFSHNQLLKIVENAAVRHADVLDKILFTARCSSISGKLFIGSLGYDITSQMLYRCFSVYGEVDDAFVVVDKRTGLSKGYGFVFFKNIESAVLALKTPHKKINGKSIVIKPGRSRFTVEKETDVSTRQIFVSNVPQDMSPGRLLEHFASYGEIEKGPLGFDKTTGKSRGFAFFVYRRAEGAKAAVSDPFKTVDGRKLTCRMAKENVSFKKQSCSSLSDSMWGGDSSCGLGSHQNQNPSSLFSNGGGGPGPEFSSVRAQQASSAFCPNHCGLSSYGNNIYPHGCITSCCVPPTPVVDMISGGCNGCGDPSCFLFSNYPRHSQKVGDSQLTGVPPLRNYQSFCSY